MTEMSKWRIILEGGLISASEALLFNNYHAFQRSRVTFRKNNIMTLNNYNELLH